MVATILDGVSPLRVFEFIAWASDSIDGKPLVQPLGLPPIQRTALWTPRQILGLWDSLLRGMPIGAFYLIPAQAGRRSLIEPREGDATVANNGLDLLDGQQRLRAMLLAVRSPAAMGKCLWVDFGAEPKDTLIPLRLTTRSQPFGYREDGAKLSLEERRNARVAFDKQKPSLKESYDHLLFDKMLDLRVAPPLPARSSLSNGSTALPFTELFAAWTRKSNVQDFVASVRGQLHGEPSNHVDRNIGLLVKGFARLEQAVIAIILISSDQADGHGDSDWLLRWFERIGAGGTALSSAERSYSIYKYYEPHIHDVVSSIERSVGYVMSPIDIVGTALRIASAKDDKFWLPDHTAFAKAAKEKSVLWTNLHELIPRDSLDASGRLGIAFKDLYCSLQYDQATNPLGLPALMLAKLPAHALQVIAYWIVLNPGKSAEELGRDEMIRFMLFWFLCSDNDEKGGRRAFEFLKKHSASDSPRFPGLELYRHLTGTDRAALPLVCPNNIARYCLVGSTYGKWRGWKDLFERSDSEAGVDVGTKDLFRTWWHSGGKMLLWLQRQYLTERFPHYDPSSDRDEEQPYDLDHIQPRASWGVNWTTQAKRLPNGDKETHFRDGREHLGNSIGNYRWIGSSENRRDGDLNLRQKLCLRETGQKPAGPDWSFGVFDRQQEDVWWRAGAEDGADSKERSITWPPTRVAAFQQAVEERTVWLYGQWWNEAGFERWTSCEIESATPSA
jgi:hypothetical protein